MKRWLLFFLLFFVCAQGIHAIGIAPARAELDYVPNKVATIDFLVLNTGERKIGVVMESRGPHSDLVSFSKERFPLGLDEVQAVQVSVHMPEYVDTPGSNIIRIIALEASVDGSGTVGAVAGVEAKIDFFVPYDGAYISAKLDVEDIAVGEDLPVKLTVDNIGKDDISRLTGSFQIYENGHAIVRDDFDARKLSVGDSTVIEKELKTEDLSAGLYDLQATINYDGDSRTVDKVFGIGDRFVDVLGLLQNSFPVGQIAKMEFVVMSKWNEDLSGMADVQILDGETKIASFRSNDYKFVPWEEMIVEAFWDTSGIPTGAYVARVDLAYGDDGHRIREFDVFLSKNRSIFPWIIALIVVLVLARAGWVLWKRRREQSS